MKNMKFYFKTLLMIFSIVIFMTSCSSDEQEENLEENAIDYSEVSRSSQVDEASAIMDDISIEVYETQEASEDDRAPANFNLPECVTITVVAQLNFREITIDFGSEGCMVHGNLLKGQIVLTYTRDPEAQTVFITKELLNFYFNVLSIEGGKTILKELSNENGNPQFTKTSNITVTWPNGAEASREGIRIREWIEGFGSGIWSDNVFEITGSWNTTFVNGNTHLYEVVIPLRREVVCFYFVSGSIDVERTNFSGVFDYGNGSCDNMATFTFANGTVVDIVLN